MEYSSDMSKSMESTINQSLYEWRTFRDDCNKLMSQPNMLNNNDSLNAQSGTNDCMRAFEDLFRENISLLYNDVTNASMHHERVSPEYLDSLEMRYEDLVCRTRDVLVEQLPNLASEADRHASIQGFRKWLQVKSDMLNDIEHVLSGDFGFNDKDQFLLRQKSPFASAAEDGSRNWLPKLFLGQLFDLILAF
uniref:Uncharacterized protein n=1 Tax=Romanomermis culicivorax TaxID=13658 RepID=A0A915JB08_ROMCU